MDPAARRYFGYVDTPNGAGGYTIRVVLPEGVDDPRSAFAHWERRAMDLCGPAGFTKQLHTARRNMMLLPGYNPTGLSYEVMGDAYCIDPAKASVGPPNSGPPTVTAQ